MNDPTYQSQIGQDRIVLNLLGGKRNGTFLDIGCSHPVTISNTKCMETDFGWSGVAVDIEKGFEQDWINLRPNSVFVSADALTIDWESLLREKGMPEVIDFLSLDLEPPILAFEVLKKLPLDKYRFNTIAFEHDDYRGTNTKNSSREYLTSRGYVLVQELNGLGVGGQDDIWIHGSLTGSTP